MKWNDGYVAEIDYTYGYYKELNPARTKLALLNRGIVPPAINNMCELGFGQGVTANIHAAAGTSTVFGTDFNPSQAGFANELASAAGSEAVLSDQSFEDFCSRGDLPDFDFIALHGIWSWISDDNRRIIVDFIRRKLNVGGIVYVSYNTLPGWSSFAPMRHLIAEHAETFGSRGDGILNRVDHAIDFAERLLKTNPLYARVNPTAGPRLEKVKEMDKQYVAHEYFNQHFLPMYFSEVCDWLDGAKVSFACSAHYLDHVDSINLTQEQQAFLNELPDAGFSEAVRDYMVSQQFRRDYWIKGPRMMTPSARYEALRQHRVILSTYRPNITLKVKGALGEATMSDAVYTPILDLMSDYKPRTLEEISTAVSGSDINFGQVLQAAMVLSGAGALADAQEEAIISDTEKKTNALNAYLTERSQSASDVAWLASPVTGGGLPVNRFEQMFIRAKAEGLATPDEWAKAVWQLVSAQGQRLTKNGKVLESDEESLAEMQRQAEEFARQRLPVLEALRVT